jgi:hypothetical protein
LHLVAAAAAQLQAQLLPPSVPPPSVLLLLLHVIRIADAEWFDAASSWGGQDDH